MNSFKQCVARSIVGAFSLGFVLQAGAATLDQRLDSIRQELPIFRRDIDALKADGQDTSYPMVTYTVLENFVEYTAKDLTLNTPELWGWQAVNGNESSATVEMKDVHTGRIAMRIVHKSPFAGNVYGMYACGQNIKLKAGQPYTFSIWAKTSDPGQISMVMDGSWNQRMPIPDTQGQWKRISKTYTPPKDDLITPRLISEKPTAGVLIDDIGLVEGAEPEAGKNLLPNPSFENSWNAHRATFEIEDMEKMSARLTALIASAKGGTRLREVPRWTGTRRPGIDGPSFIGPTATWTHPENVTDRPIFFIGYGHFAQVRNDIEKFPNYGTNIIQCGEWGPMSYFTAEDKTDKTALNRTIDMLDRGAKSGVAVDWLCSPHYFPDWMFKKYPNLHVGRADFFPYSLYRPEVHALLKQFIKETVPQMKDKSALFSICLSNEPINCEDVTPESSKSWHDWLAHRHGDIATLNARWKSSYKSFDEIVQPNALNRSAEKRPSPIWEDFIRWNNEYFANFHKMLADAVHEVAPEIPVHAKATTWHMYRASDVQAGDEPSTLCSVSDINGNDSVNLWNFGDKDGDLIERGTKDFAQGWRENAIGYDLERSVKNVPVFNSENHPIFDGENRWVDPAHIRAMLWQGAIHGQGATTIWVWDRSDDPGGPFSGNIMDRPGCVEAVGIVSHDLNRVAQQVTAIENLPPQVVILQSPTSAAWDGTAYDDALVKAYTALSFTGVKIGFAPEGMLEKGVIPDAPLLVIPNITHLSSESRKALESFKGKVVFLGSGQLQSDEYDAPLKTEFTANQTLSPIAFTPGKTDWSALLNDLENRIQKAKIAPLVTLENTDRLWGIQSLSAETSDGIVVNLYNASNDPVKFSISQDGKKMKLIDLLTNQPLDPAMPMQAMEVRICRAVNP